MPHILRGCRYVMSKSNYYRKVILARKEVRLRTRREILVNKHWLPRWILRVTVFRWFKREPNDLWEYVHRVYDNHRSKEVRSQSKNLLWHLTTVERLTKGMIYDSVDSPFNVNKHVLSIEFEGEYAKIITEGYYDTAGNLQANVTSYAHRRAEVRTCLGWCRNMPDCSLCALLHNG